MKQYEILRALGYVKSDEDGAVWEHPLFMWEDKHTWKDEKLQEILDQHNKRVQNAALTHAACAVRSVGVFNSKNKKL